MRKQGLICLFLTAGICGAEERAGQESASIRLPGTNFFVALGLIWEGDHLSQGNLDSIRKFREKHPGIPFVQYLNPAYFTKKDADPEKIRSLMATVLKPHDVPAFHLHPWKSLTDASGISYRSGPTVWGFDPPAYHCHQDCGHEVPLSAYRKNEVSQLIKTGLKILSEQGFSHPAIFMAGSFMASPQVLEAVREHGFSFDFSPVLLRSLGTAYKSFPLHKWLSHLWSGKENAGSVSRYYTQHGSLIQIAQSAFPGLSGLNSWNLRLFRHYVRLAERETSTPHLFHISMHQETFFEYAAQLDHLLSDILTHHKPGQDFFWFRTPESLTHEKLADLRNSEPELIQGKK